MNAVRELIGVITTVVILMVHMHVAVLLDIALTEMDTLATVQYNNLINTVHRITVCSNYHVDVDECDENTDGCFQTCTNTVGSFRCGCNLGYELNSDERTCHGEHNIN